MRILVIDRVFGHPRSFVLRLLGPHPMPDCDGLRQGVGIIDRQKVIDVFTKSDQCVGAWVLMSEAGHFARHEVEGVFRVKHASFDYDQCPKQAQANA